MRILEKYHSFFLSALSGILLILIFPRFDLEILAWIALIPLFFAIQDQTPGKAATCGFITGIIFYFFGMHWVVNTVVNYGKVPVFLAYSILALLGAYLSFYIALFCALCRKLSDEKPFLFILLAPWVWTALEYIRSTPLEYGFSWFGLGYSQYKSLTVIQIAEITGVYGVSALIIWVNATIYFLINVKFSSGVPDSPYSKNLGIRVGAVTALLLSVCLGYGTFALSKYESSESPPLKVSLIQGNIEQAMKWDRHYRDQVIQTYERLTLKGAETKPDLIVWPEAATPYYYSINPQETTKLKKLVTLAGTPLVFGSPYYKQAGAVITMFNSAYLLEPDGMAKGRYDKVHLVPFGEFVPMRNVLFFVEKMVEGIGNFRRGDHATIFQLGDIPFGVSICYEIIFPDLVRRPVNAGARFLVNITNDAWFGKSAASYQHFSMAALRAVENRIPIIRTANTGVSGAVDATGRFHDTTELFEETVVQTRIKPGTGRITTYARHGDWFCWLSFVASMVLATARTKLQ